MTIWIALLAVLALAGWLAAAALWARSTGHRSPRSTALPAKWALTARPVFSNDERRIFKLLLEALPDHVILAKLPLVRFCYPADPARVRYWFDLLGAAHVAFAVCSVNGRVIAAIDIESSRRGTGRSLQIKQAVLGACRVRYLRLAADAVPSPAELQMLVPPPARPLHEARDTLASTVASRRAARAPAGWADSNQSQFQDSFFAPDTRLDGFVSSGLGALEPTDLDSRFGVTRGDADVAGVVVEAPDRARTGG